MNSKFKLSFVLASIIILGMNILYIFSQVPPDGRVVTQSLVTSMFATIYLMMVYFISKKFKTRKHQHTLMLSLNLVIACSFYLFGNSLEGMFQHINSLYILQYIAIMPYIIFYGVGILAYVGLTKMLSANQVTSL